MLYKNFYKNKNIITIKRRLLIELEIDVGGKSIDYHYSKPEWGRVCVYKEILKNNLQTVGKQQKIVLVLTAI